MTALRYITIIFISLFILSFQTAYAAKDFQPQTRWMHMDLSHALTSSDYNSNSARQAYLLQQFAIQERTTTKSALNFAHNGRFATALLLDQNNKRTHSKSINNSNQQEQAWFKQDHELISNIPTITTNELLNRSQQLLTILNAKQVTLDQTLRDTAFDAKDALISIIMPGGILYASYRKRTHVQAKEELAQVANERDEIAKDVLMLQSISNTVTALVIAD